MANLKTIPLGFLVAALLAMVQQSTAQGPGGPLAFHGQRDTTNVRTPNAFVWENLGTDVTGGLPYSGMHAFRKGLIAMRMSEEGAVFRMAERPPEGYCACVIIAATQ